MVHTQHTAYISGNLKEPKFYEDILTIIRRAVDTWSRHDASPTSYHASLQVIDSCSGQYIICLGCSAFNLKTHW